MTDTQQGPPERLKMQRIVGDQGASEWWSEAWAGDRVDAEYILSTPEVRAAKELARALRNLVESTECPPVSMATEFARESWICARDMLDRLEKERGEG